MAPHSAGQKCLYYSVPVRSVSQSEIDNQQLTMSLALAWPAIRSHLSSAGIHPPREFELILAATSCLPDTDISAQIAALLAEEIDWSLVISLATRHGVIPLLYASLAAHSAEIPPEAFALMTAKFESNTRRALWLTSLLGQALDALQSHGVQALPYKGPVLSKVLYDDVARRQFSDVDLLVRPADLPRAKIILKEIGLQAHLHLMGAAEGAYLASGYEYSFDGFGEKNILELQWRILPRFYSVDFAIDSFFLRAHAVKLNERQVHTLCREDLLLVLCVHAAKHLWGRLSWIRDIADLAASGPCDWGHVLRQAELLGIARILGISFFLAQALLGAAVPPALEARTRNKEVQHLGNEILSAVVESEDWGTDSIPYFRRMASLRERSSDRLRFFARLAFTPSVSEWTLVRLPAALFPLYRVIRLFRLGAKLLRIT